MTVSSVSSAPLNLWEFCSYGILEIKGRSPQDGWVAAQPPLQQSKESDDSGAKRSTAPDDVLIQAALASDDNSFAVLIERYEGAVTAVLWHFTRERTQLEELVQETFVEAYFSLRRFRKGAPFYPWLRTIATRAGYRFWRRQRRDRRRETELAAWHAWKNVEKSAPCDTAEYLYKILEQLPPKDRLVLTLQYFEECSTREIAERTGWTLPAVKVRAFRARKRLKDLLLAAESASDVQR